MVKLAERNSPAGLLEIKEAVDTGTLACTSTLVQEGKKQSTQDVERIIAGNLNGWRLALLTVTFVRITLATQRADSVQAVSQRLPICSGHHHS